MLHLLLTMALGIVFWGCIAAFGLYWLYEMTAVVGVDDPEPSNDGERRAA